MIDPKDVENCIKKTIRVDDDNVYVTVGSTFASVTGRFENRPDYADRPISREGALKINETIIELREKLDAT